MSQRLLFVRPSFRKKATSDALCVFVLPGSSPAGLTTEGLPNLSLRMEPLDIAVVVIYFLVVLAVGIWVSVCLTIVVLLTSLLSQATTLLAVHIILLPFQNVEVKKYAFCFPPCSLQCKPIAAPWGGISWLGVP